MSFSFRRVLFRGVRFYIPSGYKIREELPNADAEEVPLEFVYEPHEVIGNGRHRSGWPYAMRCIQPLNSGHGTLLDDFIEHRFCYNGDPQPHTRPWIGVSHHPPNLPSVACDNERLSTVFSSPAWRESRRFLVGLIAMSEYAGAYLCRQVGVPVACLRHPTEIPDRRWSSAAFEHNRFRWIVQLGWYLRNTRILEQTPALAGLKKVRIWPPKQAQHRWIHEYDQRVEAYWKGDGGRKPHGGVADYPLLPDRQYDQALARNVAITEVFDASANNVIVECAARDTPLVVNRHPAVAEYLGCDYPLFFDEVEEIPGLTEPSQILAAHEHLRSLSKNWMKAETFCEQFKIATRYLIQSIHRSQLQTACRGLSSAES